jgi:hypothetical protein
MHVGKFTSFLGVRHNSSSRPNLPGKNLLAAEKIKKSGHIWFNLVKFSQIWSNLFRSRVT